MADVVLVEGWLPGPDGLRDPLWRGSLAEFVEINGVDAAERTTMIFDLAEQGWHRTGGGAAPEFTLYEARAYDELVAAMTESEE